MILRWFTLGQIIPLLVIMIILPLGWLIVSSTYVDVNQQLFATNHKLFQEKLSNLSMEFSRYTRAGENESAQRIVAVAGASSTLVYLCVVDNQGIIINATHYDWLGKKAKDVIEGFEMSRFTEALQNNVLYSQLDEDRSEIDMYYPLDISASLKQGKASDTVLVSKFSFAHQAQVLQKKQREKLVYSGMILGFVVLLLIILLRKLVSQPLQVILRFIQQIQQGEGVPRVDVKGSYEMMQLAQTLSSMNRSLKTSQADLKYTYALLENVMNSIPDLLFYKDKAGVYLGCNRAFCKFVGKDSESEVKGLNDFDLFDKEQAQFFREKDELMLKQGFNQKNEEWVVYPDGKHVLLDTLKTPYYNKEGEVVGLIGISRDITSLKSLEEQFNQAQKMEAVGTLVGGIAHDFNNILAAIMGNMYLAKKNLEKGEAGAAVEKINKIEGLSQQVATMITQLLSFSRKGVVQMQTITMQVLVKESLKLARVTIPENIQVHHHIGATNLFVQADRTQLQQLLLNLLNNARDAVVDAVKPCISIELDAYVPTDAFIQKHQVVDVKMFTHLQIIDNGSGIAKDDLEHIFEPFFTTKDVGKGTGLGLSMVYGSVQSHGGIIEVESELKQGTTFHIYLPVIEGTNHTLDTEQAVTSVEAQGETILLADDEMHVRESTADVLTSLGYCVLQAKDGKEAMALFNVHQAEISLVILDVIMPKFGGMDVAHGIRELEPNMPILFMTGYDKNDVLGQEQQLTRSHVLSKPVNFDVLGHTIRKLLD